MGRVSDRGEPQHGVVGGVRLAIGVPVSEDEESDPEVDQDDGEAHELEF
jgi:hypothetical protein